MVFVESSFHIPDNIPIIGGEWGPFINTNLTRDQQWQLFILFIVSLLLIFGFGAWAYHSSDKKFKDDQTNMNIEIPEPKSDIYNIGEFLNIDKFIDFKSLMVGMGAGLVFGFIDNGGLWFGMDALDPVFEPDTVPWVYGYGGRRPYSGYIEDENDCIYYGVQFKDGELKRGYRIGGYTPEEICKRIQLEYNKVQKKLDSNQLSSKQKQMLKNNIQVNEHAYANPDSELFLGDNMKRSDFFKYLAKHKINENTYDERITNYKNYLNNKNLPRTIQEAEEMGTLTAGQKKIKLRLKRQLEKLEEFKLSNLGQPRSQAVKNKIEKIQEELEYRRVWPGKNKKLAESWASGWRPGKLTNAGIGNTYSDFLGGFLSTFVGILIINMTGISNTSLLSEVIGLVIGCLLGILIPRTMLYRLTYKS